MCPAQGWSQQLRSDHYSKFLFMVALQVILVDIGQANRDSAAVTRAPSGAAATGLDCVGQANCGKSKKVTRALGAAATRLDYGGQANGEQSRRGQQARWQGRGLSGSGWLVRRGQLEGGRAFVAWRSPCWLTGMHPGQHAPCRVPPWWAPSGCLLWSAAGDSDQPGHGGAIHVVAGQWASAPLGAGDGPQFRQGESEDGCSLAAGSRASPTCSSPPTTKS